MRFVHRGEGRDRSVPSLDLPLRDIRADNSSKISVFWLPM